MITDFIREHKVDGKNIGDVIFKLNDRIDYLQAQIYDLQNQNFEYEAKFKGMSLAANFRTPENVRPFMMESLCLGRWRTSPSLHHHHHPRRRIEYMGMGTTLGLFQAWGRCPGIISPSLFHHHYLS
jgi:hypothetical protein